MIKTKRWIITTIIALSIPSLTRASITNEINIETNTGGNNVTGQENATVTTGEAKTSVSVQNSTKSTSNSSSSAKTKSQTTIKIDTKDKGTSEVRITQNGEKFELSQKDGKTYVKTTDSQGNSQEREWENREQLTILLDEKNTLRVEPAGEEFSIIHNKTRVYADFPLSVDQQTKTITLHTQSGSKTLTKLPETVKGLIEEQFTKREGNINIVVDQGELAYTAQGTIDKKILGLIKVTLNKTIHVSTTNDDNPKIVFSSNLEKLLNAISK